MMLAKFANLCKQLLERQNGILFKDPTDYFQYCVNIIFQNVNLCFSTHIEHLFARTPFVKFSSFEGECENF